VTFITTKNLSLKTFYTKNKDINFKLHKPILELFNNLIVSTTRNLKISAVTLFSSGNDYTYNSCVNTSSALIKSILNKYGEKEKLINISNMGQIKIKEGSYQIDYFCNNEDKVGYIKIMNTNLDKIRAKELTDYEAIKVSKAILD